MIKLSQKKTCENCRALEQYQYVNGCILGYVFNEKFKPLEPCPKPKTWNDLIECRKRYIKI